MSTAAAQIRRKATIVADYLGKQLRSSAATRPTSSPLLVSMQGPQGCGESQTNDTGDWVYNTFDSCTDRQERAASPHH